MKFIKLILGPVQTNCYLLCDEKTGKAVVIDPADNAETIRNEADKHGCTIDKIIITHGHYDHVGGLRNLKELYEDATVYAHEKSKDFMADCNANLSCDIGGKPEVFEADVYVSDGGKIPFGDDEFTVLYTPGHTSDSMSIKLGSAVFCGDTVFRYSVGRTDLPTGSMDTEIKSIKEKLLVLPDDTILYPGHGEYTTVGDERRHNPYLGSFNR